MGLPTVSMGVLGATISPLGAANLILIPSFVTNVWQLLAGPSFRKVLLRFWPMIIMIVAGTFLGASWLTSGDTRWTTVALGMALASYSTYSLLVHQVRLPPRKERWLTPLVGAATGLITGSTGVLVIPAVPYLQSLGLQKDDLVQALGLSFTVSTLALAAGLGARGGLQINNLLMSVLAILPAVAGMWVGQVLRNKISQRFFRIAFLVSMLILGSEMILRPLL